MCVEQSTGVRVVYGRVKILKMLLNIGSQCVVQFDKNKVMGPFFFFEELNGDWP
jgi:hypothetical protein